MAVVCAGAKSILDIPRTLEVLVSPDCLLISAKCRKRKASVSLLTDRLQTFLLSTLPDQAASPPGSSTMQSLLLS